MPSAIITETQLINMALTHLKQTNFISAPTDNSEQAKVGSLWYDPARRATLRACDWHFAGKNVQLTLLGDVETATDNPNTPQDQDIIPDYVFTYAYPANCLRVREIYSPVFSDFPDVLIGPFASSVPELTSNRLVTKAQFSVARSPFSNQLAIGTNLDKAWAKYTFDETDSSFWDDIFVEAFSYELAFKMCFPLTADKELLQMIESIRDKFIGEAKRLNGSEGIEKEAKHSRYLNVRT